MLYPHNIEQKLGFNLVRDWLAALCQSESGKAQVAKIQFSNRLNLVEKLLTQTIELQGLIMRGEFSSPKCIDSGILLKDCAVEGTYLEASQMLDIAKALESVNGLWSFILDYNENNELKFLTGLVSLLHYDKSIPERILRVFDDKGEIRDGASRELKEIRKEIRDTQHNLDRALNKVFKQSKADGYIPQNMGPTIRDGRLVIPVMAEYKRRVKGFIHDESSTGQTVYIEPTEALDSNNALVELQHAQRREIIKILITLADLLRENMQEIKSAFRFMALIDLIQAKARLAMELDAVMPELTNTTSIDLKEARHPVLMKTLSSADREVVPLNLSINSRDRILLVSGPNAGGKSVCLKTTGLIQYMVQCGLPVPVHPDSKVGMYQSIFVDMGDEQSIENDLSTYSSHLNNMDVLLRKTDKESLILIDEFGTGTDPQFGGAIAEAILEALIGNRCQGVITTHYGNLKEFAQENEGIVNGAMQFDMKNLEPLYSLETGRPGSSFALEVAGKIGLNKKVLSRARKIIGTDSISLENLLNKLLQEKKAISDKLVDVTSREKELERKIESYNSLRHKIETREKEIINQAKLKADELLSRTNKEIEKTIRHIKENKAQKSETQKARKSLKSFKDKVKPESARSTTSVDNIQFLDGPIRVGDFVRLIDSGVIGEVLEIKGKNLKILMGGLQTKTKLDKLRKVKGESRVKSNFERKPGSGIDLASRQSQFSTQLDIRGKRAEEVASLLTTYIDDAMLLGHQEVKILHGKGDGVLRELVRNFLGQFPGVISQSDEHVERGGAGITVVRMK